MSHVLCLALALAGLCGLCLSMQRHQHEILKRRLGRRPIRTLQTAGWTCLVLSWLTAITASGWGIGSTVFLGHLTIAAFALVLTLTWRAERTAHPRRPVG